MEALRAENDAERAQLLIGGLISAMVDYKEVSAFPALLDEIRSKLPILDSLSKVITAEDILNLVVRWLSDNERFKDVVSEGRSLALKILRDVINNPIIVAPGYKKWVRADNLREENIALRAQNDLDKCI